MRTIESKSYEADGARMVLLFVEHGKVLPFRVNCKHTPKAGGKTSSGTLAAVGDEGEGLHQFQFACTAAEQKGWSPSVRGLKLMPGIPPPSKRRANPGRERRPAEAQARAAA